MTIRVPEFEAMSDVLADTVEAVETLTPDEAVDVRIAIKKVITDANTAIAALDQMLKERMEKPIIRGGMRYRVVPDGDYVYDHDEIARQVARKSAVDEETGELLPAFRAAAEAARSMKLIYTSPSTKAKVGQLEALSIDLPDVRERKGDAGIKKLDISPATTPETPR